MIITRSKNFGFFDFIKKEKKKKGKEKNASKSLFAFLDFVVIPQ